MSNAPLPVDGRRPGPGKPIFRAGDARPFLKWAGGKRQLLPVLRRFYPVRCTGYLEPFVGSGAVFFDLYNHGRLVDVPVRLSDRSPDVVGCYRAVRDRVETVIRELESLAAGYHRRGAAHFYDIRDRRFNPLRLRVFAGAGDSEPEYRPVLAAMLIYLNRTGYNGLFRLNSRGLFNVPAGRYAHPTICDAGNLRRVSAALSQPGVVLETGGFDHVLETARDGDFVYFDPPYAPSSATARFTSYTATGFGAEEQARLQQVVIALARRGCHVLVSNSSARLIRRLYRDDRAAVAAGLRVHEVGARRAINARATGRGLVTEYLIANIPERA